MDKLRIGQKLSLSMLLLLISNLMTVLTVGTNTNPALTVGLICLIVPMFFVKKEMHKNVLSWILLALSIPTLIDPTNDISNMNGYFLFLFSMTIAFKSKIIYTVYLSIFISTLLYKFNIVGSAPSQIVGYFGALSFLGNFYQHYIHPKKQTEYTADYNNKVIKKLYIDIMILYINGYSWKQISIELKLSITAKSVQRLLDKEWKDRKFKNREQFAHYMGQMGIINNIDKNVITE